MLQPSETSRYEREVTSPERLFSRSPFSFVTMVIRIKGSVSAVALKCAVEKLQQRHALLSVKIVEDKDHALWFTSEGVGDIPIKAVVRQAEDDWIDNAICMGPAITNLGRLDFPTRYGALELDRLIVPPGGAFPLSQVNLVVGAVTCSGELSLTVRHAEEAVSADTMAAIKDRALAYLLMNG